MLPRMNRIRHQMLAILLVSFFVPAPGFAKQTRTALSAADYERAEQFLGYNTNPLVSRSGVRPNWLEDESFWYRIATDRGDEFILIDPADLTREPVFNHTRLASALSEAAGESYEAFDLPFTTFEFSEDGGSISFRAADRNWKCDLGAGRCVGDEAAGRSRGGRRGGRGDGPPPSVASPDGKRAVFIRDWNLWVREVENGAETQLTTDGVADYGYATDNAGWRKSARPIVVWSPDSKKIATFQQDQRNTGEMYLVDTSVGHPTLQVWKYPLPGDDEITMIERVVVDVENPRVIRFLMERDQHRSTLCDDLPCRGGWRDVQWSPDSSEVAFVSTSRDHKITRLRVAGPSSGEVRDVFVETVDTFFESGSGAVNWHYLPESNEVIWFSERDNWGHLYLYDLATGRLKHPITRGEGNVTQVLRVDEENRMIYFVGVGRESGRNPYYRHLYRLGFDGGDGELLTPEDADHSIALSPSGRFFVDSFSKPDVPPTAVLRDTDGDRLMTLEEADISRLTATGWEPPIPFVVKARDGETDIYGMMFRPTNFDANLEYPIINNIYPGPQSGSIRGWSFSAARGDTQAIAELGFVVVQIDGMGTPGRSKEFHEAYYGDMGDNTLPDQVSGMKQLAERYSWIDIDRAGIYGHSGGGFATSGAMFHYPDFFKVGVSQAGNHDNRVYEDDWGEKWQGLLVRNDDETDSYDSQANQNFAKNLKGKLLLAHGTLDDNVPYYSTLLVVDALIEANKDFDLILLPNRRHGFGNEPYMMRRRWDYFVEHLMGAQPPDDYEFSPPGN